MIRISTKDDRQKICPTCNIETTNFEDRFECKLCDSIRKIIRSTNSIKCPDQELSRAVYTSYRCKDILNKFSTIILDKIFSPYRFKKYGLINFVDKDTGRLLELDLYNADLKIAIEYTIQDDSQNINYLKSEYCRINNIVLIIIPYLDTYRELEDFLIQKCVTLKLYERLEEANIPKFLQLIQDVDETPNWQIIPRDSPIKYRSIIYQNKCKDLLANFDPNKLSTFKFLATGIVKLKQREYLPHYIFEMPIRQHIINLHKSDLMPYVIDVFRLVHGSQEVNNYRLTLTTKMLKIQYLLDDDFTISDYTTILNGMKTSLFIKELVDREREFKELEFELYYLFGKIPSLDQLEFEDIYSKEIMTEYLSFNEFKNKLEIEDTKTTTRLLPGLVASFVYQCKKTEIDLESIQIEKNGSTLIATLPSHIKFTDDECKRFRLI